MGNVSAEVVALVMAYPCAYCGATAVHLDHGIPLSRGGLHDIDNLVPACRMCNLHKHAKLDWMG